MKYCPLSVLIREQEELKGQLSTNLHDSNQNEQEVMNVMKKQEESKNKLVALLRIELGVEAFFQTAGYRALKLCKQ